MDNVSAIGILLISILSAIIGSVSSIIAMAYKTGKLAESLTNALNNFSNHVKEFNTLKEVVYDLDKTVVRRSECLFQHEKLTVNFCKKIDDIHETMRQMDQKRENTREVDEKRWLEVFSSLGEIQGVVRSLEDKKT